MNSDKKIKEYMYDNELNIEEIMKQYAKYVLKIIRNYNNFSDEDIEEIASDVFLTVWNKRSSLDINKRTICRKQQYI